MGFAMSQAQEVTLEPSPLLIDLILFLIRITYYGEPRAFQHLERALRSSKPKTISSPLYMNFIAVSYRT